MKRMERSVLLKVFGTCEYCVGRLFLSLSRSLLSSYDVNMHIDNSLFFVLAQVILELVVSQRNPPYVNYSPMEVTYGPFE